jgi:DNA-binding transcriptional ArsR family regulator
MTPTGPGGGRGAEPEVLDRVFDALADRHRRQILVALLSHPTYREDEPLSVGALGADLDAMTHALHHAHLPKLADAGYVEWDPGSETVSRGPRFEEVAAVVETLQANEEALPGEWP